MPASRFVCQSCGAISPKWTGKCPECAGWNTYLEEIVSTKKHSTNSIGRSASGRDKLQFVSTGPINLHEITSGPEIRTPTGISEFDRVLGGGLVVGAAILLGGDPGIGKSTIALQIAMDSNLPTLYVTGEESLAQLKMRANRLGGGVSVETQNFASLQIMAETDLLTIEQAISKMAGGLVIIDSIQSLSWDELPSAPGSVGQIRECAARLIRLTKQSEVTLLIIGHVTKDGAIAGPKILEHMVDTVLYFEGDRHRQFRVIRSFKNRFGSTNEIGIFEMQAKGLTEVKNPSQIFLQDRNTEEPGSVVVATMEGTRPMLVEIQALVSSASGFGAPRRTVSGVDYNRLAIILAVLEKKAGYKLSQQDVFLNVVGGVEVAEPAADLAVALAVISSFKNKALPPMTAVFGELGLGGEIRPVNQAPARLKEIETMGFKQAIVPKGKYSTSKSILNLIQAEKVWEDFI